MVLPFNVAGEIDNALRTAAAGAGFDPASFDPDVRPADPQHGDFQANGVLAYAKRTRQNPRALAAQLVAAVTLPADWVAVEIAGPGFINFRLSPPALLDWLSTYDSEAHLREGASAERRGETLVVDYSSPNTAKQMHVGHLRSAVIGEALCRLLDFCGARVIRDNHIGDWGTQFGKLIWAYRRQLDAAALEADPLLEFERLYKVGHTAAEADPSVMNEARQELVKLQAGDPGSRTVWNRINAASLGAFQAIYDRLGIHFDLTLGESFYNDKVEQVYRELAGCGLAEDSDGALVVFHDDHPRFARTAERPQPFLIRKSDGAANYASTDLATILYRTEQLHANGALYIVDKRQSDHFEQLFLTARKWFEKTRRPLPLLEHVDFGTVLGEDGRPFKTKSGENIKLKDLLAEAEERAFAVVNAKNAERPEPERFSAEECRGIAAIVGVASVQYADLAQNRSSDYLFSWAKMISLEGNTAPYLLYAVARLHSIFRRAAAEPAALPAGATTFETPAEIALARKLVALPSALRQASSSLRPHFLCAYLYELSGQFSTFYNADKVIVDDPGVRARRLLLCARTLVWLETGLRLLGLRTLQRM